MVSFELLTVASDLVFCVTELKRTIMSEDYVQSVTVE